ncbi:MULTISPECIES: EamA family transporter [Bacillaceae]|uniref:DMT family transporter n=1 Tax=Bacillaceae TaxID=186817 RepID=UPI001E4C016B|nr:MULTISPECIES: EamA family transporter [Bacillaceae]MCE4048150.1 EamA family transporter [Bacillus sp. Au-Bac7]MCM3033410.1 EamA family transporter [Niallia sp. MER 6]MDL0434331.1 EamA family transporter [Niallia sp. SS-2023]UPO89528.1 EamA family transporter [Niallia sp. Man26]
MMTRNRGLFFVITGAAFWGVGGTVAQKLFQTYQIDVNWLVVVRLLLSGLMLLLLTAFSKKRSQIIAVWKSPQSAFRLIAFSLFGMLAVQYTYMAAINHGNAAVATLLQYLAPIMIMIYYLLTKKARLSKLDGYSAALALGGCFLLLTNGSFSELSVPVQAVVWGVLSGIAAAFYTLSAGRLLEKFDSMVIVGWAMIIGGLCLNTLEPVWKTAPAELPSAAIGYLLFVIVFGTMIAFWFYIKSLESLLPKESSLLGSIEPLAAVLTTVFWLNMPFGLFQWLGAACIIGVILLLSAFKRQNAQSVQL